MAFTHVPCYDIMEMVGKLVVENRANKEREYQLGMSSRIAEGLKDTDSESSNPKDWYNDHIISRQYYKKMRNVAEISVLGNTNGDMISSSQYKGFVWGAFSNNNNYSHCGTDTWEYKNWRKNNPRKRLKSSMPKETRDKIYYESIGIINQYGGAGVNITTPNFTYLESK